MIHLFIINPFAGAHDASQEVEEKLNALHIDGETQIHITTQPGDGTEYVREWLTSHPETDVRIYACGGDGTLNEVLTGIMSVPKRSAQTQLTCYPCGSGNDYIKYYGTEADFCDLARLTNGVPHEVDVMQIIEASKPEDVFYSLNICNFGFEVEVCRTMIDVKRKPFIGGKNAYTTGVVKSLFTSMKNQCQITTPEGPFFEGNMLLCTLGNGRYVGGGYHCSPRSLNNDGLIELTLFRTMSVLRFLYLVKDYQSGEYIHRPGIEKLMFYRRTPSVTIKSPSKTYLCIDGEIISGTHFEIENKHNAITFVAPTK